MYSFSYDSISWRRQSGLLGAYCVCFFIGLLICRPAHAQTTPVPAAPGPTIIPSSPTAASLGRFGVIPVSHATGIANVSIPLWEAKGNRLSLPLSLNYHYTGLRLNEPASWTGMGWTLSAGGAITRSVRGLIDIPGGSAFENITDPYGKSQDQDFLQAATNGAYDTEPDVYYFNFAGHSGKFFLSHDSVFITPYQRMTVKPHAQGFVVTDDDGTRYEFFAQEVTKPNHNNQDGIGTHVSAWYLSRIVSPLDGEQISLTYETVPVKQPSYRASSTLTQYLTESELGPNQCGNNSIADFFYYGGFVNTQLVRTISTAEQTVQLYWGTRQLDRIVVEANNAATEPLRTIRLWYNRLDTRPDGFEGLQLDSVRLQGHHGERQGAYALAYYTGVFPSPNTLGLDYWGYYNGQNTNTSLFIAALGVNIPGRVGHANREPSLPHLQLGALRSLHYPTGGHTDFTYEANQVAGGDKTEELVERVVARSVATDTGPLRERWATADTVWFHLVRPGAVQLSATRLLQATAVSPNHNTREAVLSDATGRIWASLEAPRPPESASPYEEERLSMLPVTLPAGLYCLTVRCDTDEQQVAANVQFYEGRPPLIPYHLLPGPGLRIARIASYTRDADTRPALLKRYQYTTPQGQSTGQQFGSTGFQSRPYTEQRAQSTETGTGSSGPTAGWCLYRIYTAQIGATLEGLAQAGMFYSGVTEWSDSLGLAGKKEYGYEKLGHAGDEVFLTQQREYAYVDGTYRLRKSHQQTYHSVIDRVFYSFRPTKVFQSTWSITLHPSQRNDYYDAPLTQLASAWHYPFQTTSRLYDAQGREHVSATTTFYHPRHRHPTRTVTGLSTGRELVSLTRYPQDFLSTAYTGTAAVGIQRLLQQHMHAPVLEQQQWQRTATDSVLVQATATLYTGLVPAQQLSFHAPAPVRDFQPATMEAGEFHYDPRYRLQLSFDRYDEFNHLLELHQPGGPAQAYVWGYAHTKPIASVRNASFGQVAHTSFEEASPGGWTYPSAAVSDGGVTGRRCLMLQADTQLQQGTVPAGRYELSFWTTGQPVVRLAGQSVNLPATPSATRPGGWQQYRVSCTLVAIGGIAIQAAATGPCLLDEVRLHPLAAQMETYTHDPLLGLTSQTGPDGRTVFYEYDGLGRLQRVRGEQGRVLSENEYHYARP